MTPELSNLMDAPAQSDAPPSLASPAASPAEPLKRKRDQDDAAHAPPPKTAKTNSHLQINYLARQFNDDLPLVSSDDALPSILPLLSDYQGVLDRHESMACNLGARPLGPILIKRFERLFDGPPKVLKSHGKEGANVTWLDIVEFARNKPEQFTLSQMSEGVRVCQFYTKQCRVQISEEDFVLISSGIPQKMIPPQPIIEDEEKELGTIEILEKNLGQICHLADQVAARTRQIRHRLKLRQQAILDRRATDNPPAVRASSPSTMALINGSNPATATRSPNAGFVAVNARHTEQNGAGSDTRNPGSHSHGHSQSHPHPSKNGASSATRNELLSKFFTLSDRRQQSADERRRPSIAATPSSTNPKKPPMSTANSYTQEVSDNHHGATSPVPIPNTPSSLLPHHNAPPARNPTTEKDDGGPFKAEMVNKMEALSKGERILPPCDRCRRLHMDCLKNLTACMGCTKKHAKCSWKEVRASELRPEYQELNRMTLGPGAMGAGYDDLDDEPASVGQRTPPRHHSNQQQVQAAAAALQHHHHQSLGQPQHHSHQPPSPSRIKSPADNASAAHETHLVGHRSDKDVEQQLQEAARLAGVEAEAQAQRDHQHHQHHQHAHQHHREHPPYQPSGPAHIGSGIEA